jgi:hypothetical protein
MPRGGARPGAGRKPKSKPAAVVLGMDGQRREVPQAAGLFEGEEPPQLTQPAELLKVPPRDLSPDAKRCWRRIAPQAIEQRTLTPATVVGFRELCEQWTLVQRLRLEVVKATELAGSDAGRKKLRTLSDQSRLLDAQMARFKLTGFGKPEAGAAEGGAADGPSPWEEVAGR